MRKERISLLILLLLIIIPVSQALEITLSKNVYNPGETLQAEITGNFISLKQENILIYENDKIHSEPVIKDLTKNDNRYYFYAILPYKESNFSLKIQNTRYIEEGKLKEDDIIKNFTIKKTNDSVLSINPGFVSTNKDFSLKIKALNKNQEITAKLEETGETESFSLIEETEKTITFSISNLTSRKNNLKINDYNIPVFLTLKIKDSTEIIDLDFIPDNLEGTIMSEKDYSFKVFLENTGTKNLSNIKISNNFNAEVHPNLTDLEAGNSTSIEVIIRKPKEKILGEIKAEFENKTLSIPISFEITINQSKINTSNSGVVIVETLSCQNIGVICTETQECDSEIVSSLEGACCKGDCIEKKQATSYTWIIGIFLIFLLIILIFLGIRRIRKKQRLESSQEIMNERTKRYTERATPREVRGKLDRI